MRLLDLYEDLFQYICRLNRAAKTEAHPEYAHVRAEIKSLFVEIQRNAAGDVALSHQVKRLELPLIFFVDNLIATSRLNFSQQWASNRLATERNELAGDERFFKDFLRPDFADPSEEAKERLAVYYVCLGLGFMGIYQNQPDQIRRMTEEIFGRIREWVDADPRTKISAEAYRHTNRTVLTEPPNKKLMLVAIAFVVLGLSVLAIYHSYYYKASADMSRAIGQIIDQSQKR